MVTEAKAVSCHHLCLAKTQRQAKQWESFLVVKREDFKYALIGVYWYAKLEAAN